ncbi:YkyA family protein [Paenisporosarcina quisquiliarum]|uniref:YkyA family protein n=1 Tax=Paenisporosarcina quisquiliarum TaxID=365346 RepID=A0A9X3LEF2_9BACL|nr:YkyA family protein [Paenisporosarcina quisquiliarum]MCZ8536456.1 YkyA family protein [Paenisporosarcina quisquiliarum]
MKKIVIGTVLSTSLLLSACSIGTSAEQQLSDSLTKVYEEEQGYRDAQAKLAELEKKEQLTFNQTMELTQQQKEEVSVKVEELKSSLSERLTLLKEENDSIEKAQESLSSLDKIVEEAKDDHIKSSVSDLQEAMDARYEAHDQVSAEYQKLTDLQSTLYEMLTNEETQQAELQEQVVKVNEQNEVVQSAINAFNNATKELNEKKESVYDSLQEEK